MPYLKNILHFHSLIRHTLIRFAKLKFIHFIDETSRNYYGSCGDIVGSLDL